MRYPPNATFELRKSPIYASSVAVLTIILIAVSAVNMPAISHFSSELMVMTVLVGIAAIWLAWDALQQPVGRLHYAQGQWRLQLAEPSREQLGTLQVALDLQSYILLRFQPQATQQKFFPIKTQWLHLQAGQLDSAHQSLEADGAQRFGSWADFRCAVYARTGAAPETAAL